MTPQHLNSQSLIESFVDVIQKSREIVKAGKDISSHPKNNGEVVVS